MGKLVGGLVLGAVVGAVTVMLLTPISGRTLQDRLRQRFDEIMEEGRRAAAERRAELEAQFAESKRAPRPMA